MSFTIDEKQDTTGREERAIPWATTESLSVRLRDLRSSKLSEPLIVRAVEKNGVSMF